MNELAARLRAASPPIIGHIAGGCFKLDLRTIFSQQDDLVVDAIRAADYEGAERSALRRALLDPDDHRPWLDVAAAREKQGSLAGALEALARARTVDDPMEVTRQMSVDRVRLQLN